MNKGTFKYWNASSLCRGNMIYDLEKMEVNHEPIAKLEFRAWEESRKKIAPKAAQYEQGL